MNLNPKYNPQEIEDKWYAHWMQKNYFASKVDNTKKPYTIVIPPPNVTGVLHMGHMLNNTIQDVLIRRKRMQGYNACWVPGTDHASIATEAKVVQMLREKGIKKSDLSREAFLKYAFEWKDKYGGIILSQLRKLGASCDWERTTFTMDDHYYKAVVDIFVDLYEKGHVYRGLRMVNWDCKALTAVSDEEVIWKDVNEKLYYVKYKIVGQDDACLTVATTRPETILGDVAIAVNPDDERYRHLKDAKVIVPICNRTIPIIFDEYVDKEFGTGCLKVTPAHDKNDYEIGLRHNLEVIDTITEDGKMAEMCLQFAGMDRNDCKKAFVQALKEHDLLEKEDEYLHSVGFSERTDAVIEPKLSMQWFLNMKEISKPALDAVLNNEVKLFPEKFVNTYKHWMENVKDWCLSRQLWWGQQIPAWYITTDNNSEVIIVAKNEAEAIEKFKKENPTSSIVKMYQDPDVLDTWASSWIWPIEVFKGYSKPNNDEINYYYPTQDLVTAPEILFFWVARMIIAGYEYQGKKPFENVYLTGIVRDKLRRKMSKSLGNSPDPLDLIAQYGADGVRMGMLFSSPAGNDLLYDEKLVEQGRNYCNKVWNALRLVKGWETYEGKNEKNALAIAWMQESLNTLVETIDKQFDEYKLSESVMELYNFVYNEFCAWYLEMIKPEYEKPIDTYTLQKTMEFFETLMQLSAPFTPFLSEEVWHHLREQKQDCMVSKWPEKSNAVNNEAATPQVELLKDIVTKVRDVRAKNNIKPKENVTLFYIENASVASVLCNEQMKYNLQKMAFVQDVKPCTNAPDNALQLLSKINNETITLFAEVEGGIQIDIAKEKERIQSEIVYLQGFLKSVQAKLSNEKFVNNAPAKVLDVEKQKEKDSLEKIKLLELELAKL